MPYRLVAALGRRRLRHAARRRTSARPIVAEIRAAQAGAGRAAETVHVFGDLWSSSTRPRAPPPTARRASTSAAGAAYASDAPVFTGTPAELADLLQDWRAGRADRLPAAARRRCRTTSTRSPAAWCPSCSAAGAFRTAYEADTLRGLLGLPRPANRYAAA